MWYSNLKKNIYVYFSMYPPPSLIHCPIALPVPLSNVLERISRPCCERLYAKNTSYPKEGTFIYEYPLHWVFLPTENIQQNAALRCYTRKHSHRYDYRNQPLNMRMRVCYLDCHETGLCCYLVIHVENLLRPLELFCFHLWPIYWLYLRNVGLSLNYTVL
jgi:hypothetical protein